MKDILNTAPGDRPMGRLRRRRPCLEILEGRLAPTVTLSVSNPTPFPKPDTGQVQGMFVVTRSGDMAPAIQVDYATQDGTGSNAAHAGTDYTATSGTLYFAANQATATISVPVLGNHIFQADKTFTVSLSNPLSSVSFALQQTFATATPSVAVAVGDFNGDGKPDLAVANLNSRTVSVLLNTTGAGAAIPSFAAPQTFAVGSIPLAVAVGDFNGDGRPDLAIANEGSNTVSVLLNTTAAGATTPSFAPQQTFAVPAQPYSVAVGDFNDDGKPDLAVANYSSGTVSVLLNRTAPGAAVANFTPQQAFAVGAQPFSVAAGDFNGDGKPDLAIANFGSNTVSVLLNMTTAGATAPSFAPQQTFAAGLGPISVAVGDVNGDGKQDLAVADTRSNMGSVLLNMTASGATSLSFAPPQSFSVGANPFSVAAGDFNGDGKQDLAVTNFGSKAVSVLLNNAAPIAFSGSPATGTISSAPETPTSVTVVAGSSGQSAVVTAAFAVPLAVDVRDTANFLVQGASITFTAPTSGATGQFGSSNTVTVMSNASGRATAPTFTAGTVAGNYMVTAQAAGGSNSSTTFSLTNTAGPPATVTALSGANQSATVKTAFANPLMVRVTDQYGNPTPSVTVTFTGPGYGPAAVFTGGATATTGTNGVATKAFSANEAAGFYLLTATAAGGTNPSTYFLNFTNVPDVPAYLLANAGGNQSAPVNTSFATPLLATVIDQYGNPVPGVAVTFTAPGSGASATFPSGNTATSNANGLVVVPITANTVAGTYSITATAGGGRNPVTAFVNVTNIAGPATHFQVTTTAANPDVAGTPFDVTLTAQDVYGNTAAGYRGTVHFRSADPYGATLPGDYTFQAADAGVHTFPGGATLYTAGTWDVTATDTNSGITGAANVNVQAAPAVALLVQAPATAPAGTVFDVTVIAQDLYGNTDTNYAGTVTWTTTDGDPRVVLPPDYTFGPGDQGMKTFPGGVTLYTPGSQTLSITDTGSGIHPDRGRAPARRIILAFSLFVDHNGAFAVAFAARKLALDDFADHPQRSSRMSHPFPRPRLGVLPLVALLFLGLVPRASAQTVDDFEARTYHHGGYSLPYRLFVPTDYDPNQSYPLVLFLHGSGERGTDNRLQLTGQTAELVFVRPENQAQWPCFMMAPQCPPNASWSNLGGRRLAKPMHLALQALDEVMNEFNIDPDHLYITGLSMGGFGTWDTISRHPALFAAAVPIASGGDPSRAYRLVNMPIWAFHGAADTTVPVQYDRNMIAAIIAAGGNPMYTEYPGVGHVGSWNLAYAEPDLLPWMFSN